MALDITAIDLTVQQATGGIVITPSGGDQIYFKFNSSAVTNRINANGSADVGFDASTSRAPLYHPRSSTQKTR